MNTTEKLNPGERFTYSGIEWICLDVVYGNYLAMTAKPWEELPFDTGNKNDWRDSSLRRVLNSEFLDRLDRKHLVKQFSDLTADNGDRQYDTSEDYVTILSCDQYRKYRDRVPRFAGRMWTLTPWTCGTGDSYIVRFVNSAGNIQYVDSCCAYGVAPVCLFSSEKLRVQKHAVLVGVDEDDG